MAAMHSGIRPEEATAVVEAHFRERTRVVIINGGFCRDRSRTGAAARRRRGGRDQSPQSRFFFQPPLYQVATAARSFVRIFALPQLQVRLRVRRRWLWSYFAGQRSSRLIPEPARVAAP